MSASRPWDPYAPDDEMPVAPPRPSTLPVNRFRRLGMDQRGLNALDAWWDAMDHPTRIATAGHLAVLTDDQLSSYVKAIAQLDAAPEASVLQYVTSAPPHKRASNATLALAEERTRLVKRPDLIDSLAALV